MEYSANPVLIEFRDATTPSEWTSKQARRVFEAAIEAEKNGAHYDHCVTGSVMLDVEPAEPTMSPYGTPVDVAERRVRDYIARQRHALDRLENELNAYGGNSFIARRTAMRAPHHPFDAEKLITSILRTPGLRAFWVHGVKFVRDASRAFVRAEQ